MTEKTDCNTTRAWSVWLCVLAQAQAVPVRWRVGHHFITGKGNIYFLPLPFGKLRTSLFFSLEEKTIAGDGTVKRIAVNLRCPVAGSVLHSPLS